MNNKDYIQQTNVQLYVLGAHLGALEVGAKQAAKSMRGLTEALDKAGLRQRKGKAARG